MRRGSMALSELFPGVLEDLAAGGAPVWDDGDLSKLDVSVAGHRLTREGRFSDLDSTIVYSASRPLLEFHLRQRVLALNNVAVLQSHDFLGIFLDGTRVTGVHVGEHNSGQEKRLTADLVVDATGRASRMPVLLENAGYRRPAVEEVTIRLTYSSQLFRMSTPIPREIVVNVGIAPGRPKGMGLFAYENDTAILTLAGIAGCQPSSRTADMLEVVAELAPRHVVEALKRAEPLGQPARFHTPSNRWRRYDKLRRFPE